MKNIEKIICGVLFIVVGIILGLNSLDITNINIFFNGWWTLFIIIPCFVEFITDKEKVPSLIGFIIGIILLLSVRGIIDFDKIGGLIVPAILIIIGLSILFKNSVKNEFNKEISKFNTNTNNDYCSTFSEQKVKFDDEVFEEANLTAVFGGINCDLRKAKIENDAYIKCSATFGGIDIKLPNDVNVKVKSNSIFGGVSNKHNKSGNNITVYIEATCLFGGVDIK